ncbi:hypothetical protein EON63_21600 [archaeon]|nr:MAG: hypothetical protein EON63_21600 [archaeon]
MLVRAAGRDLKMKTYFFPSLMVLLASIQAIVATKADPNAALFNVEIDKCTSIAVGATAGTEGPMNTHTADCANCDFRINKVPPKDWPAGSMRPLYVYKSDYPATVSPHRGATWHPSNLEGTPEQLAAWGEESVITGYIPQVSYIEARNLSVSLVFYAYARVTCYGVLSLMKKPKLLHEISDVP